MARDLRYATEHDEDGLDREDREPLGLGLTIAIGLHRPERGHGPRLADHSEDSHDDNSDIPDISAKELEARIQACQCELDCLLALKRGDHVAARKHNAELEKADKQLAKLTGDKGNDDGKPAE
jgi:hypothetical protein